MFAVRNYQQGTQRLCAACDEGLLGKEYREDHVRLDVRETFFDGMRVERAALETMLRQCTLANVVGEEAVQVAVELGLVEAANVRRVEGVPHAQMIVIP